MEIELNNKTVFLTLPYPTNGVVDVTFTDGTEFRVDGDFIRKLGVSTLNMPYKLDETVSEFLKKYENKA